MGGWLGGPEGVWGCEWTRGLVAHLLSDRGSLCLLVLFSQASSSFFFFRGKSLHDSSKVAPYLFSNFFFAFKSRGVKSAQTLYSSRRTDTPSKKVQTELYKVQKKKKMTIISAQKFPLLTYIVLVLRRIKNDVACWC